MAANHLLGDAARDRVEVEAAVLARHLRVEDDLEQQVAEFVAERRPVVLTDRLGHLVGFLDGVRRNRLEALFEVPRAAAGRIAQPRHHVEQLIDAGGQRAGVSSSSRWLGGGASLIVQVPSSQLREEGDGCAQGRGEPQTPHCRPVGMPAGLEM